MAVLDWIFSFHNVAVMLSFGALAVAVSLSWMRVCGWIDQRRGRRVPPLVFFAPMIFGFIPGMLLIGLNPFWPAVGYVDHFSETEIYDDALLAVDHLKTLGYLDVGTAEYRLHGIDLERGERLHRNGVGNEPHLGPGRAGLALLHWPTIQKATLIDTRTGRVELTINGETLAERGEQWAVGVSRVELNEENHVVVTTMDGRAHKLDPFAMAGHAKSPSTPELTSLRYNGRGIEHDNEVWLRVDGSPRVHLERSNTEVCPELTYLGGRFLAAEPAKQQVVLLDYTTMERRRFSVVGVAVNECTETWRLSPEHFPEGGPNGVTVRSHRHGDNLIVVAMGTIVSARLADGAINWVHRE